MWRAPPNPCIAHARSSPNRGAAFQREVGQGIGSEMLSIPALAVGTGVGIVGLIVIVVIVILIFRIL
jgi:hypothetical protein